MLEKSKLWWATCYRWGILALLACGFVVGLFITPILLGFVAAGEFIEKLLEDYTKDAS